MPIPRHRLLVFVLATSLCINCVWSQELSFVSETSSPSQQLRRNENDDYENQLSVETRSGEEASDDGEEDDDGEEEEGASDDEDDGGGDEESEATATHLQYALPLANFTELVYPDSINGSASNIIYRTTDLDTAATG